MRPLNKLSLPLVSVLALMASSRALVAQTRPADPWALGIEVGRLAPLGTFGLSLLYAPTSRLAFGAGLGFNGDESIEHLSLNYGGFGRLYLNESRTLRFGIALGISVSTAKVEAELARSNFATENISWSWQQSPRLNQSLFAEFRIANLLTTASVGVAQFLTAPSCAHSSDLDDDAPCQREVLGFEPNEPSRWTAWASLGVAISPQQKSNDDGAVEQPRPLATDPMLDQTGVSPTALTLPKGAVSFRVRELLLFEGTFALTDSLQATVYAAPIPAGIALGLKYKFYDGSRYKFAWLGIAGTGSVAERDTVSVIVTGVVASRCLDEGCQSVISGHALSVAGSSEDSYYSHQSGTAALLGLNGRFRLSPMLAVMFETHAIPGEGVGGIASARFMSGGWFADLGLAGSFDGKDVLPVLGFGWTKFPAS